MQSIHKNEITFTIKLYIYSFINKLSSPNINCQTSETALNHYYYHCHFCDYYVFMHNIGVTLQKGRKMYNGLNAFGNMYSLYLYYMSFHIFQSPCNTYVIQKIQSTWL